MIRFGCLFPRLTLRFFFSNIVMIMMIGGLISGCAGVGRVPDKQDVSPEARELLNHFARQNMALTPFKGLGSFRLMGPDGRISGRMGWACIRPDRFRTDILDFGGRPLAAMASDGRWLYARYKGKTKIHKSPAAKTTFKRMIGTPVSVTDIIAFLSGGVPIYPYRKARVEFDSDQRPVLRLRDWRDRLVEEIYFHKESRSPRQVVIFSDGGVAAYRVDIGSSALYGGFVFFSDLTFSANNENRFKIRLDKLWLVDDLPASVFELN